MPRSQEIIRIAVSKIYSDQGIRALGEPGSHIPFAYENNCVIRFNQYLLIGRNLYGIVLRRMIVSAVQVRQIVRVVSI